MLNIQLKNRTFRDRKLKFGMVDTTYSTGFLKSPNGDLKSYDFHGPRFNYFGKKLITVVLSNFHETFKI